MTGIQAVVNRGSYMVHFGSFLVFRVFAGGGGALPVHCITLRVSLDRQLISRLGRDMM